MEPTKEEFLIDLENTKRELEAYKMLQGGFQILSKLPENAGSNGRLYAVKSDSYGDSYQKCKEFLYKLKLWGKERGFYDGLLI